MKESLPHGDYTAAVEAAGMHPGHARKYIAVAKQKEWLTDPKRASMRALPQTINHYAKVANAFKKGGEEAAEEVIETLQSLIQHQQTHRFPQLVWNISEYVAEFQFDTSVNGPRPDLLRYSSIVLPSKLFVMFFSFSRKRY